MKKLNDIEQALFEEVNKNIGKTLINTMNILEIPNFIEVTYSCSGNNYKLKFEKLKIHNNMGTKMNRESYQRLIEGDLEWIKKQPKSLERQHIIDIVEDSIDLYYPVL